jgi:precorrin-6A synthase
MRKMLLIGIGVGDPEYVTTQAINALNQVEVFFVMDKGPASADLVEARREICERYIREGGYRTVTVADPARDRQAVAYPSAVDEWRDGRAAKLEQAISAELDENACGGILVWGDPSLYDGTIRVMETILEHGELDLEYEVIPGISSIQALAARHRIPINRVAGAVQITTGRRLAAGLPENADDIVVMLDAHLTCKAFVEDDIDIYWGAYLGTPDEVLVSGKLRDVIEEIEGTRREMREHKGWIMDAYLLRRSTRHREPLQ